jgi:peptidoglycan hydrolase CwlO-like protein
VKILLTKVDAVYNQIATLESNNLAGQRQIRALQDAKRDLQAQLGLMVPVSDISAAKAESGRLRETVDALNQKIRSLQGEIEKLNSTVQVCGTLLPDAPLRPGSVGFWPLTCVLLRAWSPCQTFWRPNQRQR